MTKNIFLQGGSKNAVVVVLRRVLALK